jgi:transposase-like protein
MATTVQPKTLQQAVRYYSDPDTCQTELVAARWPDGVECPNCGRKDVAYLANQRRWQCRSKHAQRQFSVKVGTIFEDSPIGLDKWFVAMWMIANCKNGVSSYEIHRAIGVTQKTAWFMLHRIRLAMQTKSFRKFAGDVEADESYIGGKARFMHAKKRKRFSTLQGRSGAGKVVVMALLERHSRHNAHSQVRTQVVENARRRNLMPHIEANVEAATNMHTDALKSYIGLDQNYVHNVIDHAEKHVDGDVHTNGCENFWSLLKRAIRGTYISVEPFHLFRYLDEQTFRFNNRKDVDSNRFAGVLDSVTGRRLMYKQLIGAVRPA